MPLARLGRVAGKLAFQGRDCLRENGGIAIIAARDGGGVRGLHFGQLGGAEIVVREHVRRIGNLAGVKLIDECRTVGQLQQCEGFRLGRAAIAKRMENVGRGRGHGLSLRSLDMFRQAERRKGRRVCRPRKARPL
ncbi:hypothetical protein D3C80_1691520 [compost metagenome]